MNKSYRISWGKLAVRVACAVGLMWISLVVQSSAEASRPNCVPEASLDKSLLWISSAAWAGDLGRILAVDPLQNKLYVISPDGKVEAFDDKKLVGDSSTMVPALVGNTPDGFLLKMIDDRIVWLDKGLNVVKRGELAKASSGVGGRIGSTYDWVVAGKYLLAYGSVKEGGKHRFGFYRVLLQNLKSYNFLWPYEDVDYYLLGHKYLAGIGNDGYFLRMSSKGASKGVIYRVPAEGGGRLLELKVMPEGYEEIPPLKTIFSSPRSDEALFKEIEGSKMPVGLYGGYDGYLYLLTRRPKESGGTLWLLHQIDPIKKHVRGQVELPTSANHLTVVPGKDIWYVFEKGPVQSTSQQKIDTMLKIPASLINSRATLARCRTLVP